MNKSIRLDIGGPKGNAFYILGLVSSLGQQLGMDDAEQSLVRDKMAGTTWQALGGTGSDYNYLLRVFKETFPFVTLYAKHELPIDSDLYVVDKPDTVEL